MLELVIDFLNRLLHHDSRLVLCQQLNVSHLYLGSLLRPLNLSFMLHFHLLDVSLSKMLGAQQRGLF